MKKYATLAAAALIAAVGIAAGIVTADKATGASPTCSVEVRPLGANPYGYTAERCSIQLRVVENGGGARHLVETWKAE